jgi:predicted ATPase
MKLLRSPRDRSAGGGTPMAKADDPQEPNQHIWEYLKFYISMKHAPYFAVMIDGAWGIGKTYLVKKFLQQYFSGEKNMCM